MEEEKGKGQYSWDGGNGTYAPGAVFGKDKPISGYEWWRRGFILRWLFIKVGIGQR